MSVLKLDQFKEKLAKLFGEDTSDETLQLIEDITDTLDDYENRTKDSTNWEQKYKENDEQWRKKYRDRFFNSPAKDEEPAQENPDSDNSEQKLTFENLFKEDKK